MKNNKTDTGFRIQDTGKNKVFTCILHLASCVCLFILYLASCICLYAAFEDNSVTARSSALGGVSVVLDNDVASVLFNPASLSSLKNPAFSIGYSRLYLGLSDGSDLSNASVLFGAPYKLFSFGFGYKNFSLRDFYTEEIISGGLSVRLLEVISLGASFKNYSIKIPLNDYLKDDSVFASAYNKNFSDYTVGCLVNIWSFSVGYYREISTAVNKKHKDRINNLFGLSYRDNDFSLVVDYNSTKELFCAGLEKEIGFLSLRTGFGFGSKNYRKVTAGFGLNLPKNLSVDYALVYPLSGISDVSGSHLFTVSARFGRPAKTQTAIEPPPQKTLPSRISEEKVAVSTTSFEIKQLTTDVSVSTLTDITQDISVSTPSVITEILKVEVSTPPPKIAETPKEAPKPPVRTHRVLPGETLKSLSEKYYNTKSKWDIIYRANPDKIEKGIIKPGDVLIIP